MAVLVTDLLRSHELDGLLLGVNVAVPEDVLSFDADGDAVPDVVGLGDAVVDRDTLSTWVGLTVEDGEGDPLGLQVLTE